MQKINTPKPFDSLRGKNVNLSQDKAYFFRTSLFTEKNKNIIQKMNLSQKKSDKVNNSLNKIIIKPKPKVVFKIKNKKIYIVKKDKNNLNISAIHDNDSISKNINSKNANIIKNILNDFKDDKFNNNNDESINSKINMVESKEEIIIKNENNENYEENKYKLVNGIKNCKLFSSLSKAIINENNIHKNKEGIGSNYIEHNKSIIIPKISNILPKQKHLNQNKKNIFGLNLRTKFRLKSEKKINNRDRNKNVDSLKCINANNINKEFKYFKPIFKDNIIQSSLILDENIYFSKNKIRNYFDKRNNRYNNINENKITIKDYIQNRLKRDNIISLNNKSNLTMNKNEKNE